MGPRSRYLIALVTLLLALSPETTFAQSASSEYGGVRPGSANRPPHATRRAPRTRGRTPAPIAVTWVGFEDHGRAGTSFFVQSQGPISPSVRRMEGRVEVTFPNAYVHARTNSLWLETAHFPTPVERARLEARGHDVVLVMILRGNAEPSVRQSQNEEFSFAHFDFSPFALPAEPAAAQ